MNRKLLMISNSLFLGITGVLLTFIPSEIAYLFHLGIKELSLIILQLLGALHLGFGILNWMNRDKVIGGIYNKPIVIANLVYYASSFFSLVKLVINTSNKGSIDILVLIITYALLTLCFGFLFMVNPSELK